MWNDLRIRTLAALDDNDAQPLEGPPAEEDVLGEVARALAVVLGLAVAAGVFFSSLAS